MFVKQDIWASNTSAAMNASLLPCSSCIHCCSSCTMVALGACSGGRVPNAAAKSFNQKEKS